VSGSTCRAYWFLEKIFPQYVWLYFKYALTLQQVDVLGYRGVQLSYETIRRWCDEFGLARQRI
jgi:putative transposase